MPDRAPILLADDDENDVLLVCRAFKEARVATPIYVVRSGEEAIAYLKGVEAFANRAEYPLPSLLLLDLKMPGKSGYDVLTWIRSQPGLRLLRVVVLTSSSHLWDINRAYQLGANSFLVKPSDFQSTVTLVTNLKNYLLETDQSPEIFRPTNGNSVSSQIGGQQTP